MVNDIGTIKNVLPQTAQTSPTASVGRPEADNRARASSTQASRQAKQAEKDSEPLEEMVSDLNKMARDLHRELRFSVDQDSGDTVIKVVDRETKEVLRQIPSEEIVQLRKRLEEAAGVLFHSSA